MSNTDMANLTLHPSSCSHASLQKMLFPVECPGQCAGNFFFIFVKEILFFINVPFFLVPKKGEKRKKERNEMLKSPYCTTAPNYTFNNLNVVEMGPLELIKGDRYKSFPRPFHLKRIHFIFGGKGLVKVNVPQRPHLQDL